MKIAILLSCIAAGTYADDWKWEGKPYAPWHSHGYYRPAPLNKDGTVAETPEVKEAAEGHLAAVAEAIAKAPKGDWDGPWDDWHHKGDWRDWHRPGNWRDDWRDWNRKGDWRAWDRKGDWRVWDRRDDWRVWDRKGDWRDWDRKGDWRDWDRKSDWRVWDRKGDWRDWDRKGDWRVWDRKGDWRDWDNKGHLEGWRHGPRLNWKPAPLNKDGSVAETPEVQHLKALHFAAHAKAEDRLSYQGWLSHGPVYAKDNHHWPAPIHHRG